MGGLELVYRQRAERLDDCDRWRRRESATVVPKTWTAALVQSRFLEAFRVDRRLPRIERPKPPGSAHPTMEYSPEERAEWEAIPIDLSRLPPSRGEISRMERIFDWLLFLVGAAFDHLRVALKAWLATETRGGSHVTHCRKAGLLLATFIAWKDEAVELIARRLNRDGVAVF
jgi:hypothetical protein